MVGAPRLFPVDAILRAVSAHTAYHWSIGESQAWLVADLLILRPEMPRSLISCYESVVRNLDRLANTHGDRDRLNATPARSMASWRKCRRTALPGRAA